MSKICNSRAELKGARQACRFLVGLLALRGIILVRWKTDYVLQHYYVLLCGYTPFSADDMKEVIRQTSQDGRVQGAG